MKKSSLSLAFLSLPVRSPSEPLLQRRQERSRKTQKRKSQGRTRANCPANNTNLHTALLRAATQEQRIHTCRVELDYRLFKLLPKHSLLDLKLLRPGSLSLLYSQSLVLPNSALNQLLMFILLLNRKDSPIGLSPPGPFLCPLSLHSVLYIMAKMIFLKLKI